MLSSMKEIRAAAVALGVEASFTVGKEKQVYRKVTEILQLQVDETKYIEYYADRLMRMAKDKAESSSVPQVWSVVVLLLRCPVDRWEYFGPWLEIIQRCFNSGDYYTRLEANYAWNRLVYALHLNETSFSKTIVTVCQPFVSQLKRKSNSKQLDELRKVVIGSVCNLYYYAFKPNLNTAQVDSYWDACVKPLIQQMAFPEADAKQVGKPAAVQSDNLNQAVLILTGLFNSSTPRLWKEDHVAESPVVKPDELPALDPKWVRRNAARVFYVVEPILHKTFLDLGNPESVSYKLWRTFISAVATAASKEVKVSTDTATFMAYAFSVLARIWSQGLEDSEAQPESQQRFLDAMQSYLWTIIEFLGPLPFTEKLLSLNQQNSFIPVATPSHRPGRDMDTRDNLQLDAIEELLCSAFQSKHRNIVNNTAIMWNRAFEHADEIQYPEKLKTVLISAHSYVDIVLPGVDLSSYESSGQQPSFIESQDTSEAANPSLNKQGYDETPRAQRRSSRRCATPGSVQLSLPSKKGLVTTPSLSRPRSARRSATPRLRHDDSQIQFAPIASSSPSHDAMESQYLTDRQKEVRERQRENAVMFPHLRTSTDSQASNQAKHSEQVRDTTPQRNQGLDYMTSTPTPRRGQAPMIDFDHEMTDDIPSSPPEPRRNLLAEMKPRTRSSSVLQEFPILSSPVSGSPCTKQHVVRADEGHSDREDVGNGGQGPVATHQNENAGAQLEPLSANMENKKSSKGNAPKRPTTPRRTRSGKILESSPRTDPEVFVDAPTSPTSGSPRALRSNAAKGVQTVQNPPSSSQSKDRSFELSDDEERSLARLVIELDSRKCEPAHKLGSESPENPQITGAQPLESITVSTGSKKSRGKSKSKKDETSQSPSIIPSSSAEAESSHSPNKKSKRKRKRLAEKNQDHGGSQKKQRHHEDADTESV
ncbi:hypothetical protein PC116_g27802, partial [Phytophthora cactorum]